MTWFTDTEYLCHRWPQMYYVYLGDSHTILSSFINYHQMSTRVILRVQSEAEAAFPCGATEFASSF